MKIGRFALALAAALCLAGCYPVTSSHPVGTTTGLYRDDTLIGAWVARSDASDDKPACVTIFRAGRKLSGTFKPCGNRPGDDRGAMLFDLTSAVVAGKHFLNITLTGMRDDDGVLDKKFPPSTAPIPAMYTLEGNTLSLFDLDKDKTAEAVEAGLIEGHRNDDGDWVITAAPAKLDSFMAAPANAGRYKRMIVLERQK